VKRGDVTAPSVVRRWRGGEVIDGRDEVKWTKGEGAREDGRQIA